MWRTLLEKNFDHISRFGENRQKIPSGRDLVYMVPMDKQCLSIGTTYTISLRAPFFSGFRCSGIQNHINHNESLFRTIDLVNKILILWSIFILENFLIFFEKNHLAKTAVLEGSQKAKSVSLLVKFEKFSF